MNGGNWSIVIFQKQKDTINREYANLQKRNDDMRDRQPMHLPKRKTETNSPAKGDWNTDKHSGK